MLPDSSLNWPLQLLFICPLGMSKRRVQAPLGAVPGLRMVAREQKPPDQMSWATFTLRAAYAGATAPKARATRLARGMNRRGSERMACE